MTRRGRPCLRFCGYGPGIFFVLPLIIVLKISVGRGPAWRCRLTPPFFGRGWPQSDVSPTIRLLAADSLYPSKPTLVPCGSPLSPRLLGAIPRLSPWAYAIARAPAERRSLWLLLVMLPFGRLFLVRNLCVDRFVAAHRNQSNTVLDAMGLIDAPLRMLNTSGAVYLGIVYAYLPFMVLPLYARLEKLDPALLEAAKDLGATPWRAFLGVTLPLSLPGIIAAVACWFLFRRLASS